MKRIGYLLCGVVLSASLCRAQPALDAGKAENPKTQEQINQEAADKAMAAGAQAARDVMKMTPAQQREWMMDLLHQGFRAQMKAHGFNDLELQDQIWTFIKTQNTARWAVRLSAARLRDALSDLKSDDKVVATLNEDYLSAVESERARAETATEQLSALLKLEERPRLKALLQLQGIIGDSSWFLGDGVSGAATATFMLPRGDEMKAK